MNAFVSLEYILTQYLQFVFCTTHTSIHKHTHTHTHTTRARNNVNNDDDKIDDDGKIDDDDNYSDTQRCNICFGSMEHENDPIVQCEGKSLLGTGRGYANDNDELKICLLYTSPSPRD